MSRLQAESNTAYQDPESRTLQQSSDAETASLLPANGGPAVNFADEDGGDSPPPSLAYDGQGHRKQVSSSEFVDLEDGPETEFIDPAPGDGQGRRPRSLEDLHSAADDRTGQHEDFDSRLLARAAKYGLAPQNVRDQYQSAEQLESALLAIDQQTLNQGRWWRHQQQQQQQVPPAQQWQQPPQQQWQQPQQFVQQPPSQQQPQPGQQQPMTNQEYEEYKLSNPELFDETLSEELQNLSKHTIEKIRRQAERLQQLEQSQAAMQQFIASQQQERMRERAESEFNSFDQAIRSLGGGWDKVFGADDYRQLPPDSDQLKARGRVLQTAAELVQFHAANGRHFALTDVLQSARQMSFPDQQAVAQTSQRQAGPPRNRDSAGRYTAVPTSRQRTEQISGREKALRRADAFFAKRGMPGDYGSENGLVDY